MSPNTERQLNALHERLRKCRKCPDVCGPPVHGPSMSTEILIIGQAPGVHEGRIGKPFAHTAGKTLFKWFNQATGADEETIRDMIYFSAVTRCFPGKSETGSGDRPPSPKEIENCREHLIGEVQALKPKLIFAIGRYAIGEVLKNQGFTKSTTLNDVVGKKFFVNFHGVKATVIPLPHPSGVSRWPLVEPGKTKLAKALKLITAEFKKLNI